MRAFGIDEGRRIGLFDKPLPSPGKGSALLRVEACAICGTDVRIYHQGSERVTPPRITGHEVCGVVETSGGGLHTGDRVLVVPAIGCGTCAPCKKGYTNLCQRLETIGFQYDGGFAPYMEIPEKALAAGNVIPLESDENPEDFVLAEPIACVTNGQEPLNIAEGDDVAIFGAGFIGCIHAEIALLKGAGSVTIFEPHDYRRKQAAATIPGIRGIDPGKTEAADAAEEITRGKGFDVVVTACSVGSVQTTALEIATSRGRVSLFGGVPGKATGFLDSNVIHYKELGVFGAHASTAEQNRRVVSWIREGKLDARKYIGRFFPLEEIDEAFRALKEENLLKAVVRPGGDI